MSSGTCDTNSRRSVSVTDGPVGLFGVQTMTALVRAVIRAAMPSRSWRPSGVTGTCTETAPVADTAIG